MSRRPRLRDRVRHVVDEVEHEIDSHTAPPRAGDRKHAPRGQGREPSVLRQEQRTEGAEGVLPAGPMVVTTTGQWKGTVLGGAAGALIGALLLLPFAFLPLFLDSLPARIAVLVPTGAVAGAVAAAVYWGGRLPELEGEIVDVDGRPATGSSPGIPAPTSAGGDPPASFTWLGDRSLNPRGERCSLPATTLGR